MLEARRASGKDDVTGKTDSHIWENEQDVFDLWIQKWQQGCKGQMELKDFLDYIQENEKDVIDQR